MEPEPSQVDGRVRLAEAEWLDAEKEIKLTG